MSEHTPGPWEIDPDYMVCRLDELTVGSNHIQPKSGWEYEEADARLIAAAPDLLESLEKLHAILSKGGVWTIEDQKAAHEAIAKAKGD